MAFSQTSLLIKGGKHPVPGPIVFSGDLRFKEQGAVGGMYLNYLVGQHLLDFVVTFDPPGFVSSIPKYRLCTGFFDEFVQDFSG